MENPHKDAIEHVPLDEIRHHPLFDCLPPIDAETLGELVEDIRHRPASSRLDYPLILDEQNRVMDGRHRLKALRNLKDPTAPVIRRPSSEAPQIMLATLLRRRHLSKSVRAFLAFPILRPQYEQSRDSRWMNMNKSARSNTPNPKTAVKLAEEIGVNPILLYQAAKLHAVFEDSANAAAEWKTEHPGEDPRNGPEDLKAKYAPELLCGDMTMGDVLAGLGGKHATEGREKKKLCDLDLNEDVARSFEVRFSRWDKLDEGGRERAGAAIKHLALVLPDAVVKWFKAGFKAREKAKKTSR